MAITGNKGEWSEIYTLFKLLGDGVVYAGDGDMNKISSLFYPILSVIRKEKDNEYAYNPKEADRMVVIYEDNNEIMRLPMKDFSDMAIKAFRQIKAGVGHAFSLPDVERFMQEVKCQSLKARSVDKTDIRIRIHDLRTGMAPLLGFSIKSQLGQPSTLLNPGETTNFVYKITGNGVAMNDDIARELNSIPGQMDRMDSLFEKGFDIQYESMPCRTFEDNLIIIDSFLPQIVAECLKEHYLSHNNDIQDITKALIRRNPIGVRTPDQYYKAKMKSLLIDSALGMTPARSWNRRYDANGGYIVVREDGEVICYHFYDKNQLEDYLFNNTRLDYPSRSRYHYGSIIKSLDEYYIKLNLQIRFR